MCKEKVASYKDFRRLLDRSDINAVIVATPDHWHALLTVSACRAGKDVYVEKPLSLTVREGRAMLDTARRFNRVVQVGAQQRSGEHYQAAIKLIKSGGLGAVHKISATWTRNMNPGFSSTELRSGLTSQLSTNTVLSLAAACALAGSLGAESLSDVVVYGGTAGGVMAALAAANEGAKVTLLESERTVDGMVSGGTRAHRHGSAAASHRRHDSRVLPAFRTTLRRGVALVFRAA